MLNVLPSALIAEQDETPVEYPYFKVEFQGILGYWYDLATFAKIQRHLGERFALQDEVAELRKAVDVAKVVETIDDRLAFECEREIKKARMAGFKRGILIGSGVTVLALGSLTTALIFVSKK